MKGGFLAHPSRHRRTYFVWRCNDGVGRTGEAWHSRDVVSVFSRRIALAAAAALASFHEYAVGTNYWPGKSHQWSQFLTHYHQPISFCCLQGLSAFAAVA